MWLAIGTWIWTALQSPFWTSLTGALGGAAAGAWAGQRAAERSAERERLLEELRSTNAAVTLATALLNLLLGLKRQHLKPMKAEFDQQRAERERIAQLPDPKPPFEFRSDFKSLLPPRTPETKLEALLYEKVTLPQNAMAIFALLIQCIENLNSSLALRNALIEEIRSKPAMSHREVAMRYFGLPDANGRSDTRYPDYMDAISQSSDDAIMFSLTLVRGLLKRVHTLETRLRRQHPIEQADFAPSVEAELFPDPESYRRLFERLKLELPERGYPLGVADLTQESK